MTPKLFLDMVTKTYGAGDQRVIALDQANLMVSAGELVAIVGPSGSGKSTFLAMAGALLSPTSGRVMIGGQDVAALSAAKLAALRLDQVGFILQAANLIPNLMVRDQLLLIAELAGRRDAAAAARADGLLDELGLTARARQYPQALSGGERQRVAIARALMNAPALILADEPTASLDSRRGREVVEMLARTVRTGDRAGVIVTHDERMLDLCDRVVRIADGRLTEVGAPRPVGVG